MKKTIRIILVGSPAKIDVITHNLWEFVNKECSKVEEKETHTNPEEWDIHME